MPRFGEQSPVSNGGSPITFDLLLPQASGTIARTVDIDSAINALIDGAPGALNTLNELAAALNDDSQAYNTLLSQIAALPDSAEVATIITSYGYSTYDSTNAAAQIEAYGYLTDALDSAEAIALIATQGYLTDAIDSARITSMLAADSFSIGGTVIGDGKVEVFTSSGSPSYIDLYCEVGNIHRTRVKSDVHANYSGQVDLTLPTTSGTLALTSELNTFDSTNAIGIITSYGYSTYDSTNAAAQIEAYGYLTNAIDSAGVIALIQSTVDSAYVVSREANAGLSSGGLDSSAVINLIDSAYVQARQIIGGGSGSTDSAAIISLIQSTVDSAYVVAREADLGVSGGSGGGLDSAAVLAIHEANNIVYNSVQQYVYTADSGQSTFSGADDFGNSLSYFSTQQQVWLNGILLLDSADYTSTTGNSIVLNTAAEANDTLTIASYRGGTNATIKTSVVSYEYVSDSGQTTFTGADRDGNTLLYGADTSVLVFINGMLMVDSTDYVANNGTSIIFNDAVDSGDYVNIIKMSSSGLVTVDGLIDSIHVQQITNQTIQSTIDAAFIESLVDLGVDSSAVVGVINTTVDNSYLASYIDSAYIAARQAAGTDSATVISLIENLVDSDYVQTRQNAANGVEYNTYTYYADSGQTTFVGLDIFSNTLSYNDKKLQVFLNGLLLADSADYTATNGSSIVLTEPANVDDYISVASYITKNVFAPALNMEQYEFTADSGQTTFTGVDDAGLGLTYAPSNLLVHLNGILLTDSADYTATDGTSIILQTAADSADLLTISTFSANAIPSETWRQAVSSITTESNKKYIVDCSSSAITITLPASPVFGDEIKVVDGTGSAATNNITIDRNGKKILGEDEDFTLDINRAAVDLVYFNAAQGWIISGNT